MSETGTHKLSTNSDRSKPIGLKPPYVPTQSNLVESQKLFRSLHLTEEKNLLVFSVQFQDQESRTKLFEMN